MASHPLTLRFRSAKMERLFTQRRARRAARGTRVLLLMAFVQQILLMSIEEEAGEAALETGIEELADLEREEQLRSGFFRLELSGVMFRSASVRLNLGGFGQGAAAVPAADRCRWPLLLPRETHDHCWHLGCILL